MKKIFSLIMAFAMVLSVNAVSKTKVPTASLSQATIQKLEQARLGERVAKPAAKKAVRNIQATINIEANNLQQGMYWGIFPYIAGGTEEYTVEALFWGEEMYGTYLNDDENLEISVYDAADNEIQLSYTKAVYEMTPKGLSFTANGTGDDENEYNIKLTFFAPETPKDTVRCTFDWNKVEAQAYTSDGDYYVYGESDKYAAALDILTIKPQQGTYAADMIDASYSGVWTIEGTDTTYVGNAYVMKAEVEESATAYIFTMHYFAADSIYYIMTMPVEKVLPTDTVKHTFTNYATAVYYGETSDYYVLAKDADYIMALDIFTDELAGNYTAANNDFDTRYTLVATIVGADTTKLNYANVEAVIADAGDNYTISAEFFVESTKILYQFSAIYPKPMAKDTVTLTLADAQFQDRRDWYGRIDILAATADSSVIFMLPIMTAELEGDFTEKNLSGEYAVAVVGASAYNIDEATLNLKLNDDETILTVTGNVLANETRYMLTITCRVAEDPSAINRVENANVVAPRKVISNGQLLIKTANGTYTILGNKID